MGEWFRTIGVGALALAFVGAVVSYATDTRKQQRAAREQTRSLASALVGEIGALTRITSDQYVPLVNLAARRIRRRRRFQFGPAYSGQELFGVYRANVDKIGNLPRPLPDLVADLYTRMLTIQEDLRTLIIPEWASTMPPAQQVRFLDSLAHRFALLEDRAQAVREEIQYFVDTGKVRTTSESLAGYT